MINIFKEIKNSIERKACFKMRMKEGIAVYQMCNSFPNESLLICIGCEYYINSIKACSGCACGPPDLCGNWNMCGPQKDLYVDYLFDQWLGGDEQ